MPVITTTTKKKKKKSTSELPGKQGKSPGVRKKLGGDFPGGAVVKNPPANAGDTGSIPGPGRSHMPQSN